MSEYEELQKILEESPPVAKHSAKGLYIANATVESSEHQPEGKSVQWSTADGKIFYPATKTVEKLPCGVYDINESPRGLFFEKIPVKTEGLIRFPQTNSNKVLGEIQNFWTRENYFRSYNLAYKRGILLWGPPGCHAAGTKVILKNGSTKTVEDVCVGDDLIGPDGLPRRVLELCSGDDQMYKIHPVKGEPFVVNGHHILHLVRSNARDASYLPATINISVNDYLKLSEGAQKRWKLIHAEMVEYNTQEQNLLIDPYFLGVWLGDGSEGRAAITTADKEIEECVYAVATEYGLGVNPLRKTCSICKTFDITGGPGNRSNPLLDDLREIGVFMNKHIPDSYLYASPEVRWQLLAGLVDTDGGYSFAAWRSSEKWRKGIRKGHIDITQKREHLARQILFLARSLGLGGTIRPKVVNGVTYWRIHIFGRIEQIPVRLSRKRAPVGNPNKNPLVTGIEKVESLGVDRYYGFTLSKDHLYLTDDFIVHHNSGKSCTVQLIIKDVIDREGIVIKFNHPGLFVAGVRALREIQPETPVVVIMEDIDAILENYCESNVLNILDGCEQIDKMVFLATTNYPERLGARIINRPSRFDKRFKIGHPNAESRRLYFESLMKGNMRDLDVDLEEWIRDTKGFSLAHLKELFVAVCILGDDYKATIRTLESMKEKVSSDDDMGTHVGFNVKKDCE